MNHHHMHYGDCPNETFYPRGLDLPGPENYLGVSPGTGLGHRRGWVTGGATWLMMKCLDYVVKAACVFALAAGFLWWQYPAMFAVVASLLDVVGQQLDLWAWTEQLREMFRNS